MGEEVKKKEFDIPKSIEVSHHCSRIAPGLLVGELLRVQHPHEDDSRGCP